LPTVVEGHEDRTQFAGGKQVPFADMDFAAEQTNQPRVFQPCKLEDEK
jgi:hypothetical protein